jgi:hypothetical protein
VFASGFTGGVRDRGTSQLCPHGVQRQ